MPVTTSETKFSCADCGKEYRWKPEVAGKKAKCKCGGVIAVPMKPPASAGTSKVAKSASSRPAPQAADGDADLDGLYALAQKAKVHTPQAVDPAAGGYRCPSCSAGIPSGSVVCPNCRLDMRTGARQVAVAGGVGVLAAAGAYAAATPTARAGVLPYGGGRGDASLGARASKDVLYEGGKALSLYLPLGLIALGILFYFGQVALSQNKLSAGVMVLLVGVRIVMDSLLIFMSMLLAVRGFDMGFGAFGPGVLKILAIAMAPGALGQMVGSWVGGGMGGLMVGGFLTIVLYYTLIKVLFNLDLGETFLLVFLIYGVQQVLGTFLLVGLMGMANSGVLSGDSAAALGGGAVAVATAGPDGEEIPPKRMLDPEEIAEDMDKGNQRTLNSLSGGDDPRTWMRGESLHTLANMNKDESEAFLVGLETAGATNIRVIDQVVLKTPEGKPYANISLLMLEMPTDPAARKKIFDIRNAVEQKLGLKPELVQVEVGGPEEVPNKSEPMKDWGQRLLEIRLAKSAWESSGLGEDADEGDETDGGMEDETPAAKPTPADLAPESGAADQPPAEAAPVAPDGTAPPDPAPAGAPAPF